MFAVEQYRVIGNLAAEFLPSWCLFVPTVFLAALAKDPSTRGYTRGMFYDARDGVGFAGGATQIELA